ncbi:MAG: hypothetical protein HUU45_12510, partial [Leptospiraceae bacterium]|nr:hypothetical protein [Leptospiraceae bacterium]
MNYFLTNKKPNTMNNQALEALMRAYLRQELSNTERAAFEARLKQDRSVQQAYLWYCLKGDGAAELAEQDALRQMVESVREEMGPSHPPGITLLDRLRFAWYRSFYRIMAISGLVALTGILVLAIWANTGGIRPVNNVAALYPFLPDCTIRSQETAGNIVMEATPGLVKRLYCEQKADSLRQLAAAQQPIGLAHYFLAHLYIRNKEWALAQASLEQCIANASRLPNHYEISAPEVMRFNLLLVRLCGENQYKEDLQDELRQFAAASTSIPQV